MEIEATEILSNSNMTLSIPANVVLPEPLPPATKINNGFGAEGSDRRDESVDFVVIDDLYNSVTVFKFK